MRLVSAYLRSLDPKLPRVVWLLQAGSLAHAFGIGVVLPFMNIYLHNVRGISLALVGLAAATNALAAIPAGTVSGTLADRVGPKRILVTSLLVQVAAILCFPFIRESWHAVALQAVMGTGNGAFWPSHSSLLTGLTPEARRHAAFAQQRATLNLGIGLGGLAGGVMAVTSRPETFRLLFVTDALMLLVFATVLASVSAPATAGASEPGDDARHTYRDVLRDRPFVGLMLLNTTFIAAGIVPVVEFLPVYAKSTAGISEQVIGLIFFANTFAIVLFQVPVATAIEGVRRMRALAVMGALWAATWLVVPLAVETLSAVAAAVVLCIVGIALGVGECLQAAVVSPLVADVAPPRALGRYMALVSSSWQLAFVLGPAIGGAILGAAPVALWVLASALCAIGAAWSIGIEHTLPERVRRTPHATR